MPGDPALGCGAVVFNRRSIRGTSEPPDYFCTGVSALMAWVTPFLVFLAVVADSLVHS